MKHSVKIVLLALVLGFGVPAPVSAGQSICGPQLLDRTGKPALGGTFAADPAALAAAWLPPIERLYAAIPSLSPREEGWLEEEMRATPERYLRTLSSREYALREAKQNAGSLLFTIRVLTGVLKPVVPRPPTEDWILFAYTLIDSDSSLYLARLVTEQVIQKEAIPDAWTVWSGMKVPLQDSIRDGRTILARHVLICTLPSVLGVSMVD